MCACAQCVCFGPEEFYSKRILPKPTATRKCASPADVLLRGGEVHLLCKCQIAACARTHVHTLARACPALPLLFIFLVCGLFLVILSRSRRTGKAEKRLDIRNKYIVIYVCFVEMVDIFFCTEPCRLSSVRGSDTFQFRFCHLGGESVSVCFPFSLFQCELMKRL